MQIPAYSQALIAVTPYVTLVDGEEPFEMTVRFRTVGDASCTGAVESPAATGKRCTQLSSVCPATERSNRAKRRGPYQAARGRLRERAGEHRTEVGGPAGGRTLAPARHARSAGGGSAAKSCRLQGNSGKLFDRDHGRPSAIAQPVHQHFEAAAFNDGGTIAFA